MSYALSFYKSKTILDAFKSYCSGADSGGAGGTRAPPEFGGSEKGQSLISAYWSLAITESTSEFEKLSTALQVQIVLDRSKLFWIGLNCFGHGSKCIIL